MNEEQPEFTKYTNTKSFHVRIDDRWIDLGSYKTRKKCPRCKGRLMGYAGKYFCKCSTATIAIR